MRAPQVRWAYDDPNPRAQAVRLRNHAQIMLAAMEARGHLPTAEGAYPEELLQPTAAEDAADADADGEPDAKRHRGGGGGGAPAPMTREEYAEQQAAAEAAAQAAAQAASAADELQQAVSTASHLDSLLDAIGDGAAASGGGGGAAVAAADPYKAFLQSFSDGEAAASAGAPPAALDATVDLPPGVSRPRGLPPGWHEFSDPTTGYTYYVGPDGRSTWARPN